MALKYGKYVEKLKLTAQAIHMQITLIYIVYIAPRAETCPPPPIAPLLLVQNLSSERIAPTDNIQPKSDDAIWRHRWLKG